jgi:hypothetical protein
MAVVVYQWSCMWAFFVVFFSPQSMEGWVWVMGGEGILEEGIGVDNCILLLLLLTD